MQKFKGTKFKWGNRWTQLGISSNCPIAPLKKKIPQKLSPGRILQKLRQKNSSQNPFLINNFLAIFNKRERYVSAMHSDIIFRNEYSL